MISATICTLLITATWLPLWAQFDANLNLLSFNTVGVVLWPANIVALWIVVYRQQKLMKMKKSLQVKQALN